MVYAYPIYSTISFGTIVAINPAPAAAVPGFITTLLAGDIPGENQVGVIIDDQPLLAAETVRFKGDVIGVAVAETEPAARRASQLVQVQYAEEQPHLSIDASKAAQSKYIHTSNIACTHRVDRGGLSQGFAAAARIIKADLITPYQEHYYLEPQGCIVVPEFDGRFTVYGSIQCIYYVQKAVARALGIPFSMVTVIQTPIGGAFGGKEDIPSELCARSALAARVIGRPVKMVYRRHDDAQLTSKRHPFQMHYKIGVTSDGRLLAAEINLEENAGAYATLSSVVSYRAAMQAMGPYVIPNIKVLSTAYYTNLPPTGAFRGFGSPQATFGHERVMDHIAGQLGIDPVELRLKNVLRPGDLTQTGQKLVVSVGAEATIKQAADAADWVNRRRKNTNKGRYRFGIGIAASHYGNCLGAAGWAMDGAAAKIQIRRDGSVALAYGLSEMGQGANTVITQMAAEVLGIAPERIIVLDTSTDLVPDSGPGVASRNVVMTGNAIRNAASQIVPVLKSASAEMLETDPDRIELRNDTAEDTDSGNSVNFNDLANHLFISNRPMDALGWWHVPPLKYDPKTGVGEAYYTYSYATHIALVKVDSLTGLVQVEKIWAAHDIGRAINPAGLEGQVEGGVAQGIGWALTEHFQTENGSVSTPNLSTYLVPTAADVSQVQTILVEDPEPLGPWGAKGIGEPAVIPTGAAIANAVSQAVGAPMDSLPMTPEIVLNALEQSSGVEQTC
nr:xanthine dehydrogenase family protein [Candidatus Neomarinimicrobiota bacterium]